MDRKTDLFSRQARWFIFANDRLLLAKNEIAMTLPDGLAALNLSAHFIRQYPLRQLESVDCYCAEVDENITIPSDASFVPLRKAFDILGVDYQKPAARAYSIINWDKNNKYCGRCGAVTELNEEIFERKCPQCQLLHYPRISPSVIVLIKKDDHLLMARSPHFSPGVYGLIAGFVESGENVEDAVHREIQEEVGIKIKNLRYFGSQPWPFPDSLMIAFIAEYDSGEIVIDPREIESANWYRYDSIPGYPSSRITIAKKLIDYFMSEQNRL
ncbi:MAG TPA: NAD(+) diphosphatase [Gammaproteobacteria bacterium]|jgi:NAD+ diphosphatase|nr:NAD(+) diphosphatase [Gammaproteobacteria bacterium]